MREDADPGGALIARFGEVLRRLFALEAREAGSIAAERSRGAAIAASQALVAFVRRGSRPAQAARARAAVEDAAAEIASAGRPPVAPKE